MATLQKFKLLTLQCGASQSPRRRRKTTLKMLLSRRRQEPAFWWEHLLEKKSGDLVRRHSLKDLFQSARPGDDHVTNEEVQRATKPDTVGSGYITESPKPACTGFRYRTLLSKKAWRPVLLTITE